MMTAAHLIACVRAATTNSYATSIDTQSVDWNAWIELAELHQVAPLLARRAGQSVPAHVREYLEERASAVAHYNLFFIGELQRVLKLLGDAGITAVTYKGPVLAQQAYGSLQSREFVDADILVRAARMSDACEVLNAAGYSLQHPMGRNALRLYLQTYRQVPMQTSNGMMVVELHSALMPSYLPLGREDESLFERSISCDVGGIAIDTLSTEDHLLLLCAHATKERWPHLRVVADIAGFISKQSADWDVVQARARAWRVTGALQLALELAAWLTGDASLVARIDGRTQPDDIARIAERVKRRLESNAPVPGAAEELNVVYHTLETTRDRARFALHHVAGHSLKDWEYWPGGDHGLALTHITRPCRLAFVYTTAAARRLLRGGRSN